MGDSCTNLVHTAKNLRLQAETEEQELYSPVFYI